MTDVFGRKLGRRPLVLPDWEGYMANPAIALSVRSAESASQPIIVSADLPQVQFPLPSKTDLHGSSKTLDFAGGPVSRIVAAAFPQRVKRPLHGTLIVASPRSACRVKLDILPVTSQLEAQPYPVTVDFSQDRSGFFDDPRRRQVFQEALADWTFFLDGKEAPVTEAGQAHTWIWDRSGFKTGRVVVNGAPYSGYLLYAYGISSEELRSGGAPSAFSLRRIDGVTERPRSGTVEIETAGNYHRLGWLDPALAEQRWWLAENWTDGPADLYSIMRHEIGHALFFQLRHPGFVQGGTLAVKDLQGVQRTLPIDQHAHFTGLIDEASLRGGFGNEYEGPMPYGRWLITRADLLNLAALGHPMRPVAALRRLAIDAPAPMVLQSGCPAHYRLTASGGIPYYDWEIVDGKLPAGLTLDRHTGAISGLSAGTPVNTASTRITVQVRDHALNTVKTALTLEFAPGSASCR